MFIITTIKVPRDILIAMRYIFGIGKNKKNKEGISSPALDLNGKQMFGSDMVYIIGFCLIVVFALILKFTTDPVPPASAPVQPEVSVTPVGE